MWGVIILVVVAFLAYHLIKGYTSVKKEVKKGYKDKASDSNWKPFEMSFEDSDKEEGKFLVFDTETTGLPIDRYAHYTEVENFPRIVQLAWMLLDDEFKLISNDSVYINSGVKIPPEATRINGITNTMIKEKGISPLEAYQKFLNEASRAKVLVSHNINFDLPILKSELYRNGLGEPLNKYYTYCTMEESAYHIKYTNRGNQGKRPKLSELAGWLMYGNTNVEFLGMHDASKDTALTAKCFIKLYERGLIDDSRFEPPVLSGDILKPDFENAINKDNPFFKKKVVFTGLDDKEIATVVKELKLLGADIDTSIGKKTNFLITGNSIGGTKAEKMRENIKEGKEARMMDITECRRLIKKHLNVQ